MEALCRFRGTTAGRRRAGEDQRGVLSGERSGDERAEVVSRVEVAVTRGYHIGLVSLGWCGGGGRALAEE